MRNITNAFRRELYNDNRAYSCNITIQLTNNTELTVDESQIWQNGLVINDNVSNESSFSALGSVIVNSGTLILNNIYDDFSSYTFDQAKVIISVGLEIDGVLESVKLGTFTVDDTNYNGALINLYCLDNMHKFDKPYSGSSLVYPATLQAIVTDACTNCGVLLQTTTFPNYNITIADRPIDEAITYREVISYAAVLAGCFARCNADGKLELKWFNRNSLDILYSNIDGGVFDSATPYASGDAVDGGDFNPWNLGDIADGGSFAEISNVHFITAISSQDISVDDVIITGVRITTSATDIESTDTSHLYGNEGYVISVEKNPFITESNVATIGAYLQTLLVGLKFRKATLSHLNDPSIEAGDTALVFDRKGNIYPILVTNTTFNVSQYQRTISAAETPVKNSVVQYTEITKTEVESKKLVQQEKTLREQMGDDLTDAINAKAGMYETRVQEQGGGYTYYMHDKPLLADSTAVIKITNEAVAVTPDYQAQTPTWYGLTVDGNFIANIMSVIGINFDWGTGGTLVLGGQNNVNGSLTIKDASNNVIGTWTNTGINAQAGAIGPWTISSSAIYNGRGSIYSVENGVCISLNGICGQTNNGKYTLTPSGTLTLTDRTAADEQGTTSAFITLEKPSKNENAQLSSFGLYMLRDNSATEHYQASIALTGNGNADIVLKGAGANIIFSSPDGSKNIYLDYDYSDASISLYGNQGGEYFIAPNIKATAGLYIGTASVANSITGITRSGTTFTATRLDGTTFTFTQQDNNTTYTAGTGLTLSGTQFNLSDNELAYRQYAKTVSTDFNGITAPGIYVLDGTTMTNAPSGYTWSKLIVLMESGWGQQIVSGNNFIYQRGFTGSPGAWSAWRRVDTSVKGNAETTYRSGDVNLTPANIGALALTGGTLTGNLILKNNIYIYSKDSGGTSRVLVALTDMDGFCYGYGSKAGSVGVSYFDGHVVYIRSNGAINMQCASASINAALTVTGTITGYDYSGSSHVMVGSASDASHRVGYLYHQNPTTVRVYGQGGGSGYTTYTTLTGTSSSDIRLKEHIKGTEVNALSLIRQIEMRAFDWKPGWRDYTHQPIGMIADQIEKLDHRLVIGGGYDPNGEPNYKVIDDHYLACYLTKGVQELCDRIEMLENENKKLMTLINKLLERI